MSQIRRSYFLGSVYLENLRNYSNLAAHMVKSKFSRLTKIDSLSFLYFSIFFFLSNTSFHFSLFWFLLRSYFLAFCFTYPSNTIALSVLFLSFGNNFRSSNSKGGLYTYGIYCIFYMFDEYLRKLFSFTTLFFNGLFMLVLLFTEAIVSTRFYFTKLR